jgi:Spy/CpxP family protein refolding chaperone
MRNDVMKSLSLRVIGIGVWAGLAVLAVALVAVDGSAQDKPKEPLEKGKAKTGLILHEAAACKGYTLIAPAFSTNTYLVDMEGRVVRTWKSDCLPGQSAYLLENGNLLRTGQVRKPAFFGGGAGGRIQEFTWDGKLVWDYTCASDMQLQHHDACKLPNGNVLINLWEKKTTKEAIAAGRRPETVGDSYLLSGALLEVQPTGPTTGKIVWEWHAWDHLIQEFDAKQANHGDVGAHPELIDVNFGSNTLAAIIARPEELEKLRAIGYVGGAGQKGAKPQTDWLHVNAVAYNAALDQIMITVHEFNEIWVLAHSTTASEAASHRGGKHGRGGDLLYRWGNPRAYRAGTVKDQKLFGPHNGQWIAKGVPGEGHVLIFNNGMRRTGGAYSTVDEIAVPVNAKGDYEHVKGKAFGPDTMVWSYAAAKRTDFYAAFISGAQRLNNGNTLICEGTKGTIFEVTPKDEIVWKYVNPSKSGGPGFGPIGGGGFGGPPKLGQLLPGFAQGALKITDEQKKQLEAAEKEFGEKLAKMLNDEQKKQVEKGPVGFGPGNAATPGQLLAKGVQERLKMSDAQDKELRELQKDADARLAAILKDDQKKQLKQMQDGKSFPAGPFGGGPFGAGGFGGPPRLGQILPAFVQGAIKLTDEQKKQLEATEKDLGEKLGKMLDDEQKKQFEKGPVGFGVGTVGQLITKGVQDRLKLSDSQQKELGELQKQADAKLDTVLKDEQKKQLKQMQDGKGFLAGGGFGGGGPFGGGGFGGGFPGFGGAGGGLFRAPRYAAEYPGLNGRELRGSETIEEIEAKRPDPPRPAKDK